MRIGFIGLGTMGSRMAANLQRAGHALVVHDIRREAVAEALAAGAVWADTPRAVAEASDIILTSLPGPVEIEEVGLGPDGILAGIRADMAWFDLSTSSPTLAKKLAAAFAGKGAHMLDCPVSGGPKGAETGKLALWVGGDEAIFVRHKDILDTLGDQAAYVGPAGTASVAKLVHNCAGFVINNALGEVFAMGVKAGLDPLDLWQVVRQGLYGRRYPFDGLVDQVLPGKFDVPAFALKLAHKDVGLATALGRELGVPMRLAHLTLAEMTEAMGRGWGELDSRAFLRLEQERAGVEIAVDPERLRAALVPASNSKN